MGISNIQNFTEVKPRCILIYLKLYLAFTSMKKVIFNISDTLAEQIDIAVEKWGFANRTEFFRHASIEFLRNDGRFMPADKILHEHQKAILAVKANREGNKLKAEWNKAHPYLESDMG